MVPIADNLNTPKVQPVQECLEDILRDRCNLVPDDHTGDELLAHPVGRPISLPAPTEEAVVGLRIDTTLPHLLSKPVCGDEDERLSPAEQFDGPRGHPTPAATVEVAQEKPNKWIGPGRAVLSETALEATEYSGLGS